MFKQIALSGLLAISVTFGPLVGLQPGSTTTVFSSPNTGGDSPEGSSLGTTTLETPDATVEGNLKRVATPDGYRVSKTATSFDTSKQPAMHITSYLVVAYTVTLSQVAVHMKVSVQKGKRIRVRELAIDTQKQTILEAIGQPLTADDTPTNTTKISASLVTTPPPPTGKHTTVYQPNTLRSSGYYKTTFYDPIGIPVASLKSVMTCTYNFYAIYGCSGYGEIWGNSDGWYFPGPIQVYMDQNSTFADLRTYGTARNDAFFFQTTVVNWYPNTLNISPDGSLSGWANTAVTQGAGSLLHDDSVLGNN